MGKTVGQTLGAIGGGVIGFFASGGNPFGAIQGISIGLSLGTLADPPDLPSTQGPRIDDKQFQSSEYGAGIPLVKGDTALRGNVIYLENGEYKEVAYKQQTGGKGGAPKQEHTTYTYYATFGVAICESVPGAVVRRIWLGSDLVFNADSDDLGTQIQSSRFQAGGDGWLDGAGQSSQNEFTSSELTQGGAGWVFYDGSQTEPDPRMESVLGVGNCPAYTGTAYIMFYDLDLTDYGNNLSGAQVKVEILKSGRTPNITKLSEIEIDTSFFPASGTEATWYLTPQKMVSQLVRNNSPTFTTYKYVSTPFGSEGESVSGDADGNNPATLTSAICDNSSLDFFDTTAPFNAPTSCTRCKVRQGVYAGFNATSKIITLCLDVYVGAKIFNEITVTYTPRDVALSDDYLFVVEQNSNLLIIYVYDLSLALVNTWATGYAWTGGAGEPRTYYDSGWLYWAKNIASTASYEVVQFDPINEVTGDSFTVTHTNPNTTGTYNRAYNFTVFGNLLCSSEHWKHSIVTFRHKVWKLYDYDRSGEALDDVVQDFCNRAGISNSSLDVTELSSDTVRGFLANSPTSARANLAALQTAYLFDLVEDGYTLKAIKRGGASVKTITQEELDARPFGAKPGVLVAREREMNNRLPSRYSLTFIGYNREYENITQTAEFSTNSENQRAETLPIVLTSDEGIQLADVLGRISWIERDRVSFTLSLEHIDLKASDVISLETFAGNYEDVRIEEKTELADQRVQISGRITDSNLYSSTLVGMDGTEPDSTINFIGASYFIPLDIPMILDTTDEYGFSAALYGPGSYPGGVLLKSLDGEQTWTQIQGYAGAVSTGQATDILPAHEGFVTDRENTLNIKILAGSFDGITEAQMLAGLNFVAYGADGRWEIMRFAGSTLEADGTYTLDTFIRGYRGTEQYTGTHAVDDKVVLLSDSDMAFLRVDSSEVAVARDYKPVTVGMQAEYADSQSFTYNAVNLKCLSPVHGVGVQSGSDWVITWKGRTRYSSSFWYSGSQPDNEDTLSYEVDVMNGASVVRTLTSSTATVTYTSAQQTTDFGGPQFSVEVNIYQIGNTSSRGYALNETFTA